MFPFYDYYDEITLITEIKRSKIFRTKKIDENDFSNGQLFFFNLGLKTRDFKF